MGTFRDLTVYRKAFKLAMEIYEITKKFPEEEKYSLISQIRRSSRAVCSNIGEAYRKRKYEAHFVSKATDADMENTETQVWLDFSFTLKFMNEITYKSLVEKSDEIGKLLHHMIEHPEKYQSKNQR